MGELKVQVTSGVLGCIQSMRVFLFKKINSARLVGDFNVPEVLAMLIGFCDLP